MIIKITNNEMEEVYFETNSECESLNCDGSIKTPVEKLISDIKIVAFDLQREYERNEIDYDYDNIYTHISDSSEDFSYEVMNNVSVDDVVLIDELVTSIKNKYEMEDVDLCFPYGQTTSKVYNK